MRKLFSYIIAGIALLSASACVHEQPAVFDPSKGTAPVLLSYNVDENGVSAEFTPGSIDMGFNKNVPLNHSFAIVKLDGAKMSKTLPSNVADGKISISKTNLSKTLMGMGKAEGSTVAMELAVRMSLQDPTKDSGINGFIDSKDLISIGSWVVEVPVPQGNPWGAYTEKSTWSVIGDIASTGNAWNQDEAMFTDGSKHVAKGLKLAAADQFKIRNNGGWDDNRGAAGDVEPFIVTIGEPLAATANGKNLSVPADGTYDLLYDPATETITLTEAFLTYPGFDSVSEWSVIGAIASFGMEWNKDIEMSTDGTWHVAEGVELKASDQFKFRKNQDWTDNFGATGDTEPFIVSLDTEYEASAGGKNLAVPEDGVYDLLVNPEAKLFKVVATLGGSCHLVGEGPDNPDTPQPTFEGWSITGAISGSGINWDGDIDMAASGAFWVARDVKLATADQFKFRKAHDWAENVGATGDTEPFVVEVGAKTAGAAGGKNLAVPAEGTYDLYLNPEELSFYVMTAGEVPAEIASWGVVGTINNWGGSADLAMVEENGMLVRKNVALTTGDQFKIRYMSSWDVNRGAPGDVEPFIMGTDAIAATQNGKNLGVAADGNYDVWYDALNEILFVVPTGTALSYWGVVGNITGWGGDRADYIMYKSGDFYAVKGIELNEDSQFKIRYNSDWAVNRGAPGDVEPFKMDAGSVVDATQNGKNLGVNVAGKYDIYYNAAEEKLYVMGEGNDPSGAVTPEPPTPEKPTAWSIIGTIGGSSWGKDFDLTNTEGDIWKYEGLTVTDTDEFKIRANHDWGTSVGGPEENEDSGIDPVGNPYKVFRPTIGTAFAAGGVNIRIAAAGTYNVTFDYAAKTILIEGGAAPTVDNVINDAAEMIAWLASPTDDAELAADIDLSGMAFSPAAIKNFDGKGHKVTYKLSYNGELPTAENPDIVCWGLFGTVSGTVKNLSVAGQLSLSPADDSSTKDAGGSTIGYNVGGVAGRVLEGGKIENCESSVEIIANTKNTYYLGGIAGVAEPGVVLSNCTNKGLVKFALAEYASGNACQLGGIIGQTNVSGSINGCVNDGELFYTALGTARMGGMVGYINKLEDYTIKDCTNNGNITSDFHWTSGYTYLGGISGYFGTPAANGKILYDNCENNGAVKAVCPPEGCARVGGIASYGGNSSNPANGNELYFKNCRSNGLLSVGGATTKKDPVGGIAGMGEKSAKFIFDGCVVNCTCETESNYAGGLVGQTGGTESEIKDCVVTDKAVIKAKTISNLINVGLFGGANAKFTAAVSGKVKGGTIVKDDASTAVTAENFASLLFGVDITGSTDGVVFE